MWRSLTGTIEDHQLVFDENRLRHHRPNAAWANKSSESYDEMNEKDDEITHFGHRIRTSKCCDSGPILYFARDRSPWRPPTTMSALRSTRRLVGLSTRAVSASVNYIRRECGNCLMSSCRVFLSSAGWLQWSPHDARPAAHLHSRPRSGWRLGFNGAILVLWENA
jgi:hypothetical protein